MKKTDEHNDQQGEIVIYQNDDGSTKIDVRFVDETVWLTKAATCRALSEQQGEHQRTHKEYI